MIWTKEMGRAPCCEKMGLKKGPWTAEEDQILVSHILRFGHRNWRALPKLAGLLRCGKSCRLRWTNYLRPDIKRGNFSKEEEETIIRLHESLGNKWSAIAAKLPGRTDNEIKNVWHTNLKKKLNSNETTIASKRKTRSKTNTESKTTTTVKLVSEKTSNVPASPSGSYSNIASSETESSKLTEDTTVNSSMELPDIDESFWNEMMSTEVHPEPVNVSSVNSFSPSSFQTVDLCNIDGIDFWLRAFMQANELHDLPEI